MPVFKTTCPRCGTEGEVWCDDSAAIVNCGECLFNDVEVVQLSLATMPNEPESAE